MQTARNYETDAGFSRQALHRLLDIEGITAALSGAGRKTRHAEPPLTDEENHLCDMATD